MARGRVAVMAGSFWRSEPAAALRGFTKVFAPLDSSRSFISAKSSLGR